MARTIVIGLLVLLVAACSKKVQVKVPESELRRIESIGAAYNRIEEAVDAADPVAYIKLYDVARNDELLGAEYSEVAIIKLTELLYYKTQAWVDAFSKLPAERLDSLENFQRWAYIGEVDFQLDSTVTQERYREVILSKLDSIQCSPATMDLVRYLREQFRAAIDSDRVVSAKKRQ
jgi:hypothetical protein